MGHVCLASVTYDASIAPQEVRLLQDFVLLITEINQAFHASENNKDQH